MPIATSMQDGVTPEVIMSEEMLCHHGFSVLPELWLGKAKLS
jgi:hypothetical protein